MADNILGETIEGVASLPAQIATRAVKTVLGKPDNSNQDFVEGLTGKPVTQQKMKALQVSDQQKKQQNLAAVRSNLKSLMTPVKKPQPQPPPYISGKAGFSIEKIKKMQKLQEEQKKNLPAGRQDRLPPLPVSAKQGQGSGEIGKFVAG